MVFELFKKKPVKAKPKHAVKKVKRARPTKHVKKIVKRPVKIRPKVKKVAKPVLKKPVKKFVAVPKAPVVKLPPIEKMPDEIVFNLIKDAKIPLVPYAFCKKENDVPAALKKIKFPVVMKVSSPKIVHKTEVGGVIKNINSEAEAMADFRNLMKIKGAEKVLIQKQVSGLELIVGAKADPQFGYIVSVGLGGIYVEILKDVTFRVAPISQQDAADMVRELKGYDILAGARGAGAINFEALYAVLISVGKLVGKEKLKELDINPLICTSEGCWAADVRAIKKS